MKGVEKLGKLSGFCSFLGGGREKNPPTLPCFIEAQLTKKPAYMYAVRVFSEIRTLHEVASTLPHAVSARKGPEVLILVATGLH